MSDRATRAGVVSEGNSSGGRLVGIDGRLLPLRSVALRGDAAGGLGRIILEQRFQNPYPDPLRVTYQVPLPPDAAVSGYSFQIGERRVVGEVDRLAAARERFEQALAEGHTAGLLEQIARASSRRRSATSRRGPRSRPSWSSTSGCGGWRKAPGSGASPRWWRRV
ncbi:MAG TPA: VIT domain-containing protein, partial [Candidatus Acidoferrum sp.]|nr:VIT domain-containing protein [Candidatus Acidoferrum sp.]